MPPRWPLTKFSTLLVIALLILTYEYARSQGPATVEMVPVNLKTPIIVRIVTPVPVMLVAPVDDNVNPVPVPVPTPVPVPAPPSPRPVPLAKDTALSRAGREYIRTIPMKLPDMWLEMADQIDMDKITSKTGAVALHSQLSTGLNTALDQVFSAGIDSQGKIVNKDAITRPLRQSALAIKDKGNE